MLKPVFKLFICIFLSCIVLQSAYAQSFDTTKEIHAIERLVKNYEDAWNRHDPKGLAANYDSDATWVNWFGAYYVGRDDIERHYDTVHTTYFKTSQYYTRQIEDIKFLTPTIAIAHVRTGLSGDTRYPGQVFEFRRMIVLTKHKNGWLIKAGQNAKLNPGIK
jgi:uncharacterized protein (TIGR02246 family)